MNRKNLIRITGEIAGVDSEVLLPLTESFGFTVGSEFSTPFDTGGLSGGLQKLYALTGVSQKMGMSIKNMYSNPTPTEISFEAELVAYQDAAHEVVLPALFLMAMALGTEKNFDDLVNALDEAKDTVVGKTISTPLTSAVGGLEKVEDKVGEEAGEGNKNKLKELIHIIRGPATAKLHFGEVYTIPNAYITSVAPQFSNNVDSRGNPLSATISITCTVERFPTADDVFEWFNREIG